MIKNVKGLSGHQLKGRERSSLGQIQPTNQPFMSTRRQRAQEVHSGISCTDLNPTGNPQWLCNAGSLDVCAADAAASLQAFGELLLNNVALSSRVSFSDLTQFEGQI